MSSPVRLARPGALTCRGAHGAVELEVVCSGVPTTSMLREGGGEEEERVCDHEAGVVHCRQMEMAGGRAGGQAGRRADRQTGGHAGRRNGRGQADKQA